MDKKYYVLRREDGTFSFLSRNETTLEGVRSGILNYADGLYTDRYYQYVSTWSLGRLLSEFGLTLYFSTKPVDDVRVQFSKSEVAKLVETVPELESSDFSSEKRGN